MIGKLIPGDPKPNSDQVYCENCEMIIDKLDIVETIDGKSGCTECISQCGWCGHHYFSADMYSNPYLGYVCKACENAEDYLSASRDEVLKDALRCLFDATTNKRIENEVIRIGGNEGYNDLANEMKSDL